MGLIRVCKFASMQFTSRVMTKFLMFAAMYTPVCTVFFIAFSISILPTNIGYAQPIDNSPTQTQSIVRALDNIAWQEIENGLEALSVSTPLGIKLNAFKISPDLFSFSVVQQSNENGENVESYAGRSDGVIAINGGFFAKHSDGSLSPVGLLIVDGIQYTRAWAKKGGFLIADKQGLQIIPSKEVLTNKATQVIQSRPVIIESGSKWALNRNLRMSKNRTLVCVLKSKEIILLTFSGLGLSLFEAGWTLRSQEWGGWFDCDSAIALDGGGSTQLFVKGHRDLWVHGDTNVQNALVVKRKVSN